MTMERSYYDKIAQIRAEGVRAWDAFKLEYDSIKIKFLREHNMELFVFENDDDGSVLDRLWKHHTKYPNQPIACVYGEPYNEYFFSTRDVQKEFEIFENAEKRRDEIFNSPTYRNYQKLQNGFTNSISEYQEFRGRVLGYKLDLSTTQNGLLNWFYDFANLYDDSGECAIFTQRDKIVSTLQERGYTPDISFVNPKTQQECLHNASTYVIENLNNCLLKKINTKDLILMLSEFNKQKERS